MPKKPISRSFFHTLILEIILGIVFSLSSLTIFLKFAKEVMEKDFSAIDLIIENFVYSLRNPLLTSVMARVTNLGSTYIVLLGITITFFLYLRKHYHDAFLFFVALLFGGILNLIIKQLFHLPRPNISPLVIETSYSFPSGHAMNSMVFYALLVFLTYHLTHHRILTFVASIIASILVLTIGFSRVYLGVHHPSDIIAGFIVGFWWIVTILIIERSILYHQLFEKQSSPISR